MVAVVAALAIAATASLAINAVAIIATIAEEQIKWNFQRDQLKQQLVITELQVQAAMAERELNQTDPKRLVLAIVRVPELVIIKL